MPLSCQNRHRLVVRDARKRRLHPLELGDVALQDLQLAAPRVQRAPDDIDEQPFGERHDVVQVGVRHLGLDHPEFRQVPPRLRLLGAERRPEAVHPAERHRVGLVVELTALRQVGRRVLEVLRRKQGRRPFARGRREDRRVGQDEAARVEVVADGVDDFVADAQDRLLALGTNPQMPAIEQVVDAVLLRRDGIVLRGADDLESA